MKFSFFAVLLAGWSVVSFAQGESEPQRPNVLFILIDDFGWKDVGYNGSTFYETPRIDEFSREWM